MPFCVCPLHRYKIPQIFRQCTIRRFTFSSLIQISGSTGWESVTYALISENKISKIICQKSKAFQKSTHFRAFLPKWNHRIVCTKKHYQVVISHLQKVVCLSNEAARCKNHSQGSFSNFTFTLTKIFFYGIIVFLPKWIQCLLRKSKELTMILIEVCLRFLKRDVILSAGFFVQPLSG